MDAATVVSQRAVPTQPMLSGLGQPTGQPADQWVGRFLGKYQVTAVLGRGGMGLVLKARDPMIDRDVAIKILANNLAGDTLSLERFLGEARSAGRLSHPNVVGIHEVGQEGDLYFLVMEYVPGGSLDECRERQGALSVLDATRALIDACRGVAAAHAAGLIHRDIKPANFLRASDGSIKVTDFGLAKGSQSHGLTQTGTVIGTPFFMSPEQCEGQPVDGRSDVYSLGAAYYALLTGRNPYQDSSSIVQIMYAHCQAAVPDPRAVNNSVPPACSRIVARAMAKARADRYQTVNEMLADLELVAATLTGQTLTALPSESGSRSAPAVSAPATPATSGTSAPTAPRSPSRRVVLGVAAALAVLLAAALLWWRPWDNAQSVPSSGPSGPDQAASAAGSGAGADSAAAAVPSGEPVKVGVLHSLSGTMAGSENVVVDATLFALNEINESGGVLGRPLKAVIADGRSDPATFAREAERLIAEEKVSTVFGCWTSASRKTVKTVVEEHDHLLVYPLQYEGLETSPNIVYMGAAPNQQILPAVEWAIASLGKRRFFLVGSDYVFPRAANEIIKDKLKQLGAVVVGEQYLPLGSADAKAAVEAITAAKPDMILNTINGDSNVAFFRALRLAGVQSDECPTLSFSIGEAVIRSLDAGEIAGDYAAWTYFESVDTPENREFVARFHERFPQRHISDPMESAYVGLKAWAMAVNDAGSLEPRKIRRAMLEQRFSSPGGEVRIDADTQHCYKTPRIARLEPDGRYQIVWSAPQPAAPEPFPSTRTTTEWLGFLHDLYTGWGNRWSAP
jgi:urea transport system substrate-binding protein